MDVKCNEEVNSCADEISDFLIKTLMDHGITEGELFAMAAKRRDYIATYAPGEVNPYIAMKPLIGTAMLHKHGEFQYNERYDPQNEEEWEEHLGTCEEGRKWFVDTYPPSLGKSHGRDPYDPHLMRGKTRKLPKSSQRKLIPERKMTVFFL